MDSNFEFEFNDRNNFAVSQINSSLNIMEINLININDLLNLMLYHNYNLRIVN